MEKFNYMKNPLVFCISSIISFVSYSILSSDLIHPEDFSEERILYYCQVITLFCTILSAIGGLIKSISNLFLYYSEDNV